LEGRRTPPYSQFLFHSDNGLQERREIRNARSRPLLASLKQWLEETLGKLSRKSDTAMAVRYALGRWEALMRSAMMVNGIDPESYLRNVLSRIADHSINRIEELLPWKPADAKKNLGV
jgi:transposase